MRPKTGLFRPQESRSRRHTGSSRTIGRLISERLLFVNAAQGLNSSEYRCLCGVFNPCGSDSPNLRLHPDLGRLAIRNLTGTGAGRILTLSKSFTRSKLNLAKS